MCVQRFFPTPSSETLGSLSAPSHSLLLPSRHSVLYYYTVEALGHRGPLCFSPPTPHPSSSSLSGLPLFFGRPYSPPLGLFVFVFLPPPNSYPPFPPSVKERPIISLPRVVGSGEGVRRLLRKKDTGLGWDTNILLGTN